MAGDPHLVWSGLSRACNELLEGGHHLCSFPFSHLSNDFKQLVEMSPPTCRMPTPWVIKKICRLGGDKHHREGWRSGWT